MGTSAIEGRAWLAAALLAAGCHSSQAPSASWQDAGAPLAADAEGPPTDAAAADRPADDGAGADAAAADQAPDPDAAGTNTLVHLPGWSVRKWIHSDPGTDVILEEVLAGFGAAAPGQARIRTLAPDSKGERIWTAPAGQSLSDFCAHRSGELSAILIATDQTVSLVRLSPALVPLGTGALHDPLIATDPHVDASGSLDLRANGLSWEAARIASADETVLAVVATSWNSVVAYRTSFADGSWAEPRRTLVEPPAALTPFLPTGGSFDTFGAMVVWYRPLLDVDQDGNAYVAIWASPGRIRAHAAQFQDGLRPIGGALPVPDSDVLVTRLDRSGTRVWSRIAGTIHEDEPYALRARAGAVAVVGRARRFPGFDNTTWDAFVAVLSSTGEPAGTRVVPLEASGIFLALDWLPGGGWVLGGSDGWSQNPEGLSVLSYGTKLLAWLPGIDGALSRVPLAPGPRHNEIRAVLASAERLSFAGHEDGPIMHTGDSDPRLITATGLLGGVPAPIGP
jgi:hypothetical protein